MRRAVPSQRSEVSRLNQILNDPALRLDVHATLARSMRLRGPASPETGWGARILVARRVGQLAGAMPRGSCWWPARSRLRSGSKYPRCVCCILYALIVRRGSVRG